MRLGLPGGPPLGWEASQPVATQVAQCHGPPTQGSQGRMDRGQACSWPV